MLDSGIRKPRGDRGSGVLKAHFVLKISNIVGRLCDGLDKSAKIQNAIDWANEAIKIGMLTKTILGHVVVRNGQSVVVEA